MKTLKHTFTRSITFTLKLFTLILYRSEINWLIFPFPFAYSGGLHHIQVPEKSKIPKFFKTLKINYQSIPINEYKELFSSKDLQEFKKQVINDLEERKNNFTPS